SDASPDLLCGSGPRQAPTVAVPPAASSACPIPSAPYRSRLHQDIKDRMQPTERRPRGCEIPSFRPADSRTDSGRSVSMRSARRVLVLAARSRSGFEMPAVVEVDQGALGWSKPSSVPGDADGVDPVAPTDLADRVGQVVADGCR